MSDVECVFCRAEGWVTENDNAAFQNKDGSVSPLYGIYFTGHYGDCPFAGIRNHRGDYRSKEDAIKAHKI